MSDRTRTATDDGAFFELALDLFCIAGLDTSIQKVNPSFERTLGYTREELQPRKLLDLVHPDDRASALGELKRLSEGLDVVQFEVRCRRKDGSWCWLAWTCPAPASDKQLLYAVARDITSQKKSDEQLRIRDSIFSSMENGLLITDPTQEDNPIVYCNDAFCRLSGYAFEEVLGRNCRFLQGGDRLQPQLDVLRKAIKNEVACRVLLRNYRKDGSLFWNELVNSPVRDADGRLTHFVGLQYDVSCVIHANSEGWKKLSARLRSLAPRQRQVLDLLVVGENTKSIAQKLSISPKTVEIHRARVLDKMGVESQVDLVRLLVSSQTFSESRPHPELRMKS